MMVKCGQRKIFCCYVKETEYFEVGRFCGMEMNVVKTKVMSISRQPSPKHIMIYQKQLDSVEYFNCVGSILR
jgi:hypothetical protein